MGGNPEIRTDLWDGHSYDGDQVDAKKTIWAVAAWVQRQRETSVEFHHLVEILGLELALQEHLDEREDPPTKRR